jgi:hypothetical protein
MSLLGWGFAPIPAFPEPELELEFPADLKADQIWSAPSRELDPEEV